MDPAKVRELATGQFFTGIQAHNLGLVDALGSKKEVENHLKQKLNLTTITFKEYKEPKTFIQALMGAFSEHGFGVGYGLAAGLQEGDAAVDAGPDVWV